MKPVTMAIVGKDGAVDTVWSSQMAVIAPSFDGIDRRRPNLNKRLAVSRSRAGGRWHYDDDVIAEFPRKFRWHGLMAILYSLTCTSR